MKLMNRLTKGLGTVLVLSLVYGCSHFDEINTNPDGSTTASRSLLATNLILNLTSSSVGKSFYSSHLVSKSLAWGESVDGNQYNVFGRTGFDDYGSVIDATKMLTYTTEANRPGYEGLFYFVKAYRMFYLTMAVGDIPYQEAFLGEQGQLRPKYNTQKEVLIAILDDLDRAASAFDKGVKIDGDPIFKGDMPKWQKTVRAFQLKVLLHLSIKATDPELKVAARFAQYAKSDLMQSNADNFQRTYSDNAKEFYPVYFTRLNHNPYAMVSNLIVDKLKETEDYRLFYYAKPAKSKLDAAVPFTSFDAYLGVNPADNFDIIKDLWGAGKFSNVNERYTHLPSGEPIVKLGYAEQQFILAEAALRGWISGGADSYYKEGIRASMKFTADHTPDNAAYHHDRKITESHIQAVLNHPKNQLTGSFEGDLEKILYQKYLGSFLQREWETYYDYRRTGYPKFPIDPNTNQNTIDTQMPLRWMYPTSEYDNNSTHIAEALKRQWNGVDDVNKVMWMLQK